MRVKKKQAILAGVAHIENAEYNMYYAKGN